MPDRRRSRTLLAVLTLIALVVITIDYRQGDDGPVAALQRGALVVFGPVQEGFVQVARPIGGFFSSIGQLGSLRAENAALRAELEELRQRLPSVADLERENAELRAQLQMRERLALTTTAARVIGRPPSRPGNSILIDAGADNGIEPGMAVINADGLVGKVVAVTGSYARVELLSSPTARYAVRIAELGVSGLLQGQGPEPFRLEVLDPEAEIPPGAEVVTRTFESSTIPDGIPVGEVTGRPPGAGPNSRYLAVQPYVDFARLQFVQVVLDAPTLPRELDPDELVPGDEPPRPDPPTQAPTEQEPTEEPTPA